MEKTLIFFDTTLRDGAQTMGVDFSLADKNAIAGALDEFGIDFIEGGWPGANPDDDSFFNAPPVFNNSKLVAFGMTRRANTSAGNDPSLSMVINSSAPTVCLVGKSWDFQVTEALGIELNENIDMIADSIKHGNKQKKQMFFDAEHFFDGYKNNPDYALKCLAAAYDAGVDTLVLCDTNGGTLPHEIYDITAKIIKQFASKNVTIGIHSHDDTGNAVANSIAAVQAGATHIQGTLNGLGERCGNANLISLIPTFLLKMGYRAQNIDGNKLQGLLKLSRLLDDRLNQSPFKGAPYVGTRAFAHKGGLHASGMAKNSNTYEHIAPEQVGNQRRVIVSNQAGRANIAERLIAYGLDFNGLEKYQAQKIINHVKNRESQGYSYDGAEASFALAAFEILQQVPAYYHIKRFRVIDEKRLTLSGEEEIESEATLVIEFPPKSGSQENIETTVAFGQGPINALDKAMRDAILSHYSNLKFMQLIDYKVRIIPPPDNSIGTDAVTRVTIESRDNNGNRWETIGVSVNIIDASMQALNDAYRYNLKFLQKQ
ncbi:MAG: citramalate synthase [Alphaproteobacteria bacterium]|nr:citramalate synthase [Alphaproteobacteria bacterium]